MASPQFDSPPIPVTAEVLREAEGLSGEILKDIELSQVPLSVVALKAMRLARILNDFEFQQIFEFESGGYPREPEGVSQEVWELGRTAGRLYSQRDSQTETTKTLMNLDSVQRMEQAVETGAASLNAAHDPDISITSANQYQHVPAPKGNAAERQMIRSGMDISTVRLAARRTFIYNYAIRKHYEIRFSSLANDVFGRIVSSIDSSIGSAVPDAVKKLTAVHENLMSDNPEDWANAVHSCRRVLQDLADAVFPAQVETRSRNVNGRESEIRLGADQYINRLMAYIDDSSESSRFTEIVGSHLGYIGDRLDAIFEAAQKGSHATVTKEEADRYVVYTYLVVGDILSLRHFQPSPTQLNVNDEPSSDLGEEIEVTITNSQ